MPDISTKEEGGQNRQSGCHAEKRNGESQRGRLNNANESHDDLYSKF